MASNGEQVVTDAEGKRVGVRLDLDTYKRLCQAEAELNDIAADDVHQALIYAEQASDRPIAKDKVMAIVNLTADSCSDGGTYQASDAHLIKHCEQLIDDGASIVDLGAE